MSVQPAARFSLRDLPLPAKIVITCFLLAVGCGYSAAMVQLHMQDSKTGAPMPTMDDVILKYTGCKKMEGSAPAPVSTLVRLVTAPETLTFSGAGSMAPAFTSKSDSAFAQTSRIGEEPRAKMMAERHGERDVLVLWAKADPEVRKRAYADDHFGIAPEKAPKQVTARFKSADDAFKIKSIIETRCVRCHMPDGEDSKAANIPLQTYEEIEKYLAVPTSSGGPGDYIRVQEPISFEKLTQSTHAHLLSFAMLFSLTGLVFSFTTYPTSLRCILSPLVLLAVVVDVSLWWCARLCDHWGPYFAMGIIGTGGVAGVGLGFQIVLSLFNMYGAKGKLVILILFLLAGAGAGLVIKNKIMPGIEEKQKNLATAKENGETKPEAKNGIEKKEDPFATMKGFEKMLQFPVKGPDGKEIPLLKLNWKREQVGGMVRAFFDKDSGDFAAALKAKDEAAQAKMTPQRHTEREALQEWNKLPDPERKKAYELDLFVLPPELAKKPASTDYIKAGKMKIQTLIMDRCIHCHADKEDVPFSNYEELKKYLR